jgi:hypothetical protein
MRHFGQYPITHITVQQLGYAPAQQRQATCAPRQRSRHQQRNVADVVSANGDRYQAFRAVQCGDLRWRSMLAVGEQMGGGRPGKGDVGQLEIKPLGD